MQLYKMQALGNDFVVFGSPTRHTPPEREFIRHICDRHYGLGADCAVFIGASKNADYFMHVYNPDGFEAEICGNALRCSAKYVKECGYFKKNSFIAETLAGLRTLKVQGDEVIAEIGKAEIIMQGTMEISGVSLPYTSVSLGNPHCVVFVTYGLDDSEFNYYGYTIEHHPLFPDGTNVEFACITDNNKIVMRVWERGIGETYSCSTGSCACAAAAQNEGRCNGTIQVYQPGGIIEVNTGENGNMFITGKCTTVYKATLCSFK